MKTSRIRHIVNLWSLVGYPPRETEWTLEKKLRAVKEAGFDGFMDRASDELGRLAKELDLIFVGFIEGSDARELSASLARQRDAGARHINVQLGNHDTPTDVAVELAVRPFDEAKKLGVEPAIEVHRDTCTETPEKTYALADAYERRTGDLLPLTWDFSHLAVVKHLAPEKFAERLLVRPDLIQRAQQFHCRPFNGHHCQVPVTDGRGNLTPEVRDYLAFAGQLFKIWIDGNRGNDREIFVCPEMGPVPGGYNLSTLPNSWEDAKVLRPLLDEAWRRELR